MGSLGLSGVVQQVAMRVFFKGVAWSLARADKEIFMLLGVQKDVSGVTWPFNPFSFLCFVIGRSRSLRHFWMKLHKTKDKPNIIFL